MTQTYRVIDLRNSLENAAEITIEGARSPEDAVRQALGIHVARSGRRQDLVARVYWQPAGQPVNMVRLYTRSAHDRGS